MKPNIAHNSHVAVDKQSRAFFSNGKMNWKNSQADVWNTIEQAIESKPQGRVVALNYPIAKWAIAATIALLISVGGFMRFYKTTVSTPAAQHLLVSLPDGSSVKLNALSTLSYNPYWWRIERQVKFEGEGFFEVQKGKVFRVDSKNGKTQVLGTSFNIFSRDQIYKVTCITGSVRVTSITGQKAVLQPNSKAEIEVGGTINVISNIETLPEISWRDNLFLFTASPIQKVFYEIERQYGIKIDFKADDYSLYTGNFSRNQKVEEVLQYICPALGLKYTRKSDSEYQITREDE